MEYWRSAKLLENFQQSAVSFRSHIYRGTWNGRNVTVKRQVSRRKYPLAFLVVNFKHLRQLLILSHAPLYTRNLLLTMSFHLFVFSLHEHVPAVSKWVVKSGYEEGNDRNRQYRNATSFFFPFTLQESYVYEDK